MKKIKNLIFAIIPIIVAILIFGYLKKTKVRPKSGNTNTSVRKIRFMKASLVNVTRKAIGYGHVSPAREWTAYSEVKGKIVCIGFSLFQKEEIRNWKTLLSGIRRNDLALFQLIHRKMPKNFQKEIQKYQRKKISEDLKEFILKRINYIVQKKHLCKNPLFLRDFIHNRIRWMGPEFSLELTQTIPLATYQLSCTIAHSLHRQRRLLSFVAKLRQDRFLLDRITGKNHITKFDNIKFNRMLLQETYSFFKKSPFHKVQQGQFIPKGRVICQVDPTEYNLAIRQNKISIQKNEIQIKELEEEFKYLQRVEGLEKQRLLNLKREYERQIAPRTARSTAEIEAAYNNYLQQLKAINELEKQKKLIPIQIENLQASIELSRAQLEQAELDRDKTVIKAPFDIRITQENVEFNQVVSQGQVLLQGYGIDKAEVIGQFQFDELRPLFASRKNQVDLDKFVKENLMDVFDSFRFKAEVSAQTQNHQGLNPLKWEGYVSRILSSVSTTTQTISVAITVDDPYGRYGKIKLIPGVRPPLVKGMYCKVSILGPKVRRFMIPRSAYQQGKILLWKDGVLKLRKLELDFIDENYAFIQKGLKKGEKIVLTDVFPAIPGTPLSGMDQTEAVLSEYRKFANEGGQK